MNASCEAGQIVAAPVHMDEVPGLCGGKPARLYVLGCKHEHIWNQWLCADCATGGAAHRYCVDCFDLDNHICDVMVTPAPEPEVAA